GTAGELLPCVNALQVRGEAASGARFLSTRRGADFALTLAASGPVGLAGVLAGAPPSTASAGPGAGPSLPPGSRAASRGAPAPLGTPSFTVTTSAGIHGSISPSGAVVVDSGSDQAFAITPATGYHVADVLVDGVSV